MIGNTSLTGCKIIARVGHDTQTKMRMESRHLFHMAHCLHHQDAATKEKQTNKECVETKPNVDMWFSLVLDG